MSWFLTALVGLGSTILLGIAIHLSVCTAICPQKVVRLFKILDARKKWVAKSYLFATWLAFGLLTYGGLNFMLAWMPGTWGTFTEYGDYKTLKGTVAGLLAIGGGMVIPGFLWQQAQTSAIALGDAYARKELERLATLRYRDTLLQESSNFMRYYAGDFENETSFSSRSNIRELDRGVFFDLARIAEKIAETRCQ